MVTKTLQCRHCKAIDEIKDTPKLSNIEDQTSFEVRFDENDNIYWICPNCAKSK